MSSTIGGTRTITEMVAEMPHVDRTPVFEQFWQILSGVRDRITAVLPVSPHPSTADHSYWSSPDGAFEGSLNGYSADDQAADPGRPTAEWFVHSWAGNRKNSILDMNITVWLGPQVDVPHLCLVLGTVPHAYHYSDLIARRDVMTDVDYVQRYFEPENADFLSFWADPRFTWSVSHGTYMRSILSPVGYSFMSEVSDDVIEELGRRIDARVTRWLHHVETAAPVPVVERAALQARDHLLRKQIYGLDPMNKLAASMMGEELTTTMVGLRMGSAQMESAQMESAQQNGVSS